MALETGTYISDLVATNPTGGDQKSTSDDHHRFIKSTIKTTFPNITGAVTPTHTVLNYMVGVTSAVQTQIDSKGAITGQTWTGAHVFPSTVTIGSTTATELSYVHGLTSAAQTQINAKGAITGQTWTGAHDYTGATMTVAAPTVGSNPATKTYADNLAFSVVLPSQTGNSGKYVTTDGTNASWGPIHLPADLLAVASPSGVATVDFTSLITTTYDEYEIHFHDVVPASNASLYLLGSKDNGANFVGGTAYSFSGSTNNGTNGAVIDAASINQAQINITLSSSAAPQSAGTGVCGVVRLSRPASNEFVKVRFEATHFSTYNAFAHGGGQIDVGSTFTLNAIRFLFSTGNIASGYFELFGIRKTV